MEDNFKIGAVNHEAAAREAKERATARKERERRERHAELERERARAVSVAMQKAKTNLKHVRIVQRNLVYIIGLSLSLAREEILRRSDMFGKFGRITRVLVNRSHPYNSDMPGGPSISAYVQYARDNDATQAVRQMNLSVYDGRELRCAIACTKYCDVFVSAGISDAGITVYCDNDACLYIHELITSEDVLTREEVLTRHLGPPPPAYLFASSSSRRPLHNVAVSTSRSAYLSTRPRPSLPAPNGANQKRNTPTQTPTPTTSALQQSQRRNITPTPTAKRTPPVSPEPARPRILRNPRSPPPRKNGHTALPTSQPITSTWSTSQSLRSIARSPQHASPSPALEESRRKANSTISTSVSQPISRVQSRFPPSPPRRDVKERSPPPGFERIPLKQENAPARPPGFEQPLKRPALINSSIPITTTSRNEPIGTPLQSSISVPDGALKGGPPPGFGMPVFAEKESELTAGMHPPMSWIQEASTDQIVSSHEMLRGRTVAPVGAPVTGASPSQHGSNPGFVDVLGRIGGPLGVSSEVNLNPVVTPYQDLVNPSPGRNPVGSNAMFSARPDVPPPLYPAGGMDSSFDPFPGTGLFGERVLPQEIKPSKRSNSRFGFARDNPPVLPPMGMPSEPRAASRFDFASNNNVVQDSGGALHRQPYHDQLSRQFEQLSTADKLASLFNTAQWAPMPQLEPGAEPTHLASLPGERTPPPGFR